MKGKRWILLWLFLGGALAGKAVVFSKADSAVLERFWKYAGEMHLEKMPFGERIIPIANFFLGSPYKAGTLNVALEEMPVINLREFDCVTFVENTLALTFLPRYDASATGRFVENLIKIRYRNGKIESYLSRLHYSGDWFYEMQKRHFLSDVTQKAGGIRYPLAVGYMSRHYKKYPVLAQDTVLLPEMRKIETEINARAYYYIPKHRIVPAEKKLQEGDILLITTNIKGLDTSHLGFAVRKKGRIHLLHASSTAGRIVVTDGPLADYTADIRTQTGIMVGRVLQVPGEEWIALP